MAKAALRGIYVLIIHVKKSVKIRIGALGTVNIEEGTYAYVGSAQKNLEHRVRRHLRREKRKFWHIDYLLDSDTAEVVEVRYKSGNKTEECKVAQVIAKQGKAVEGFGASDCCCISHLFQIENQQCLEKETQLVEL